MNEVNRRSLFHADPILADFVSCAIQDAGLREQDEACTDGRKPNDSGTIYTLQLDTFNALRGICDKFHSECQTHIDAALELEPGSDGLRYARNGNGMTLERIGSTLWLAITGSGVTFTDDGDAPCLQAMADWARSNSRECLYFGDDAELYLI